ncbi:hypothetical protein IMZ68_03270 [Candidatus Bathyarchaeota archaeon]|nr:hypothetical protein [Candidatus Bathyarchaeota archaeon]
MATNNFLAHFSDKSYSSEVLSGESDAGITVFQDFSDDAPRAQRSKNMFLKATTKTDYSTGKTYLQITKVGGITQSTKKLLLFHVRLKHR